MEAGRVDVATHPAVHLTVTLDADAPLDALSALLVAIACPGCPTFVAAALMVLIHTGGAMTPRLSKSGWVSHMSPVTLSMKRRPGDGLRLAVRFQFDGIVPDRVLVIHEIEVLAVTHDPTMMPDCGLPAQLPAARDERADRNANSDGDGIDRHETRLPTFHAPPCAAFS